MAQVQLEDPTRFITEDDCNDHWDSLSDVKRKVRIPEVIGFYAFAHLPAYHRNMRMHPKYVWVPFSLVYNMLTL